MSISKLNTQEKGVAINIISQGLIKAAESLSFFMNEKITFKEFSEDEFLNSPPIDLGKKDENNIHFLTTRVIGDLKGVCCLIFSEDEADSLRSAALPAEILESPEMMSEMSDGIMLEVDNIISASVITEFSNLLKVKIHGSIPDLKKVNFEEMESIIADEMSNKLFRISFKISFESSNSGFNPEFIWLFDNAFIECIKEFTVSKEA